MERLLPPEGELITDLDELVFRMGRIAAAAPEVDLPHIQYGMYGYSEVTRHVTEWVRLGKFDDNEKMASTMPDFAERSFRSLRHHIHGERDQVGTWAHMFYSRFARRASPGIAMGDFLSTHVYYDLPKTLLSTDTLPEHQHDYAVKINTILSLVGEELLPRYVQLHPILDRLKIHKKGLNMVLNELFDARDVAWNSFVEMKASEALSNGTGEPINWLEVYRSISTHKPRSVEEIDKATDELARRKLMSSRKLSGFAISRVARFPQEAWVL